MNTMPKMLRSCMALLLALAMLMGVSVVAMADDSASCGEDAARKTVEKASYYCEKAAVVVDVVAEYALGEYKETIAEAVDNPEGFRPAGVSVIKVQLKKQKDVVAKVGFDPENSDHMNLLANEIYDVAIAYYIDTQAEGEEVAKVKAMKEVIRFTLVEVDGYAEEEAVETAERYYELNEMAEEEAVQYVMSLQEHSYEVVVTDPTCTKDGYTTYTCSACGDSYVDTYVDATGHAYETVVTEPTCTEQGYTTLTCSDCGSTMTENVVEATGHTAGEAVVENEVAATCTEDGSYELVVYCTECDAELSRETIAVEATGHIEGENAFENEIAATCTEDGSYELVVYCTECDAELSRETVEVKTSGHTAGEAVVENEVAATCTEVGSHDEVVYCTVCDDELSRKTIVASATGHTAGETVVENEVAATCTEVGSHDEVVYCTVCDDELSRKTIVASATGHTYEAVVTEPTCTEQGYTTLTCSDCGSTMTENVVEATDHTAGEAVVENEVAAICTEDGSYDEVVFCAVCGEELSRETVVVPATDHDPVSGVDNVVPTTCTEAGSYDEVVFCAVCGEELSRETVVAEPTGHDYVNGTCTVCGEEDPDYVAPTEPEEENPSKPSFSWKDLFEKWFGNKDEEEEPTEPEVTEPEDTEPEESVPSTPVEPVNPIRDWLKKWLSIFK